MQDHYSIYGESHHNYGKNSSNKQKYHHLHKSVSTGNTESALSFIKDCGYTDEILTDFLMAASRTPSVLGGEA